MVEEAEARTYHDDVGTIPANDNVPGTITPDDRPFFIALGLMCAGVVALLAYVMMSGSGDLMTAALRK